GRGAEAERQQTGSGGGRQAASPLRAGWRDHVSSLGARGPVGGAGRFAKAVPSPCRGGDRGRGANLAETFRKVIHINLLKDHTAAPEHLSTADRAPTGDLPPLERDRAGPRPSGPTAPARATTGGPSPKTPRKRSKRLRKRHRRRGARNGDAARPHVNRPRPPVARSARADRIARTVRGPPGRRRPRRRARASAACPARRPRARSAPHGP